MVTAMSCAFYSFSVLPLAEVYSLLFSFPLIVTVLSIPILGEVVRAQRWAAVGVGLIGVLIVLRPGATDITAGHVAALTAAFCSAFASVLVRKIGNEERSAVLILYPMLLAIVTMSLAQPAVYQPPSLLHLGMMALVGLFSVIAQHLIILAYRAAPAGVVAPSQYSQIIWATIFGAVFFGESPDAWVAVGASIIIASGVFVVWRESRVPTPRCLAEQAGLAGSVKPRSNRHGGVWPTLARPNRGNTALKANAFRNLTCSIGGDTLAFGFSNILNVNKPVARRTAPLPMPKTSSPCSRRSLSDDTSTNPPRCGMQDVHRINNQCDITGSFSRSCLRIADGERLHILPVPRRGNLHP